MALPADPEVLGWYRFGPAPGAGTGSVVLAGHLDSERYGLGPLVGLREVEVGDRLRVTRADGTARRYAVVDVRRYDRQALPEELFARTGPERLRIITCGGEYLPDAGGYQQNLVVTAVPN
jgi:sortase (surface protein transpeptidase)